MYLKILTDSNPLSCYSQALVVTNRWVFFRKKKVNAYQKRPTRTNLSPKIPTRAKRPANLKSLSCDN